MLGIEETDETLDEVLGMLVLEQSRRAREAAASQGRQDEAQQIGERRRPRKPKSPKTCLPEAMPELVKEEEPGAAPIVDLGKRRRRRNTNFADFVVQGDTAASGDDGAGTSSKRPRGHARARPTTGGKSRGGKAVLLNNPPPHFIRRSDRTYILEGGVAVSVKASHEKLLGVDRCDTGKYRARYASRYLGRFATPEAAALAHDNAALADLRGEPLKPAKRTGGGGAGKDKSPAKAGRGAKALAAAAAAIAAADAAAAVEAAAVSKAPAAAPGKPIAPGGLESALYTRLFCSRRAAKPKPIFASDTCWVTLCSDDVALSCETLDVPLGSAFADRMCNDFDRAGEDLPCFLLASGGEVLSMTAHAMRGAATGPAFLRCEGPWGVYARARQLLAGTRVVFSIALHAQTKPGKREAYILAKFTVDRQGMPLTPVSILEPNVESEIAPEALGFCYVRGRLSHRQVCNALHSIKESLTELPAKLAAAQSVLQEVCPFSSQSAIGTAHKSPCRAAAHDSCGLLLFGLRSRIHTLPFLPFPSFPFLSLPVPCLRQQQFACVHRFLAATVDNSIC